MNKFTVPGILLLFAVAACATDRSAAMQRFKGQMDQNVIEQSNITPYIGPNTLDVLRDVQEVRPGVMEYSFESRHYWSVEVKCKYIFVVAKDTSRVIGWRYNGKPENCLQAR